MLILSMVEILSLPQEGKSLKKTLILHVSFLGSQQRDYIPAEFVKKYLHARARLPPIIRIVIRIRRRHRQQLIVRRQSMFVDILRPSRVVIRSNQQDFLPAMGRDELADHRRLIPRVVRLVREWHDRGFRHPVLDQIALHQIRGCGVRTQGPPGCHHTRRHPGFKQGRGPRRALRIVIVATQHHDYIRSLRWLVHHPEFSRQPQQRHPREIQHRAHHQNEYEKYQPEENPPALARPPRPPPLTSFTTFSWLICTHETHHELGSICRNCSAACSGYVPLK